MGSTIECYYCDETADVSSQAQCPNDVIDETGFVQDGGGNWICPDCQKMEDE